jgi:hypothetical protein
MSEPTLPGLAAPEPPGPGPGLYAETVDAMLAAAGLTPNADERAAMLEIYAIFRPRVDALHALAEARYEAPAPIFSAAPKLAEWGT